MFRFLGFTRKTAGVFLARILGRAQSTFIGDDRQVQLSILRAHGTRYDDWFVRFRVWHVGFYGFLRAHLVCYRFDAHQSLWRPRQEENLEQVQRVERRRITVSICKTYRQKWWEKEDDPNPSFRRREVARVLFDLATELFRFKLNR